MRIHDVEFPECIALEVTTSLRRKMLLLAVYRPPSQILSDVKEFGTNLDCAIASAVKKKKIALTLLVGDFNAKHCDLQPECMTNQAGFALYDLCSRLSMK